MAEDRLISVASPEAQRRRMAPDEAPPGPARQSGRFRFDPASINLAKRLDTLENKTIYLVDIGFGGGHSFMLEIQRWFVQHMPSVKTVLKRKPGQVFSDDGNELWEEIKAQGDAVILGVAG
jgi:hypothetical protein